MIERKKALFNLVISILTYTVSLAFGLIIPRIVLTHYGSDTNGFTGTMTQIFTYVNLLEAGISTSARNLLYKPIVENDKNEISKVLSVARRQYRSISIAYIAIVLSLSTLMPLILKTNINYWTVFCYILFEGGTGAICFYFSSSWVTFLQSNGNTYIVNIVTFFTRTLFSLVKILLMNFSINIAFMQVTYFFLTIIQVFLYWIYFKKKFPWITYTKVEKKDKLKDRNSYILTEIAWTIFSSTDMIVLSVFVSTAASSIYSVYNLVLVSINAFLNAVYSAINYILGQIYNKDIEIYKKLHDLYNCFFVSGMTVLLCVAYILILPFIALYTQGISDIEYIRQELPLLFCLIQLISWSRYVSGNLSGIAGYAKLTCFFSLLEAGINLVLSVALVNKFGISGVLIATVIALPIKAIFLNILADKVILKRSAKNTLKILLINYLIFGLTAFIRDRMVLNIPSYPILLIYAVVLTLFYIILIYGINILLNRKLLESIKIIKQVMLYD